MTRQPGYAQSLRICTPGLAACACGAWRGARTISSSAEEMSAALEGKGGGNTRDTSAAPARVRAAARRRAGAVGRAARQATQDFIW